MSDDKDHIIDKFKDIDHSEEMDDVSKGIKKKTYREKRAEEWEESKKPRDLIQFGYVVLIFFILMGIGMIMVDSIGIGISILLLGSSPLIFKSIKHQIESKKKTKV